MKYPFVIFFRYDKYNEIDNYLNENKDKLNMTITIINNNLELNKLFNSDNQVLITYGQDEKTYINDCNLIIADRMRKRWIHYITLPELNALNYSVNFCFMSNCIFNRIEIRPVFSAFTTSYNSYNKILRAYNSLLKQTLLDWEWVILDDSPTNEHFEFLFDKFKTDNRIRLYKRAQNSGNIGNVKNEAVSLCRGKYVLELDHDDEIMPYLFKDSAGFFDANPDYGFIYMDFFNIYENGNNFFYGDFISKGYGAYYTQKYENKWIYVYITPNINNITLSSLTCCPNHPRIWRKSVLLECGNYSEFLPICDDYEILLRTCINTKVAKFTKIGYIQYMNEGNNNFSLIRNAEINRIGPNFIYPMYFDSFKVNEKMAEINAHEDEKYIYEYSQIWKRGSDYKHKFMNKIISDYLYQYCIIGFDSLLLNLERINYLYKNPKNDFILLENKAPIEYMWNKLNLLKLDKFKCYSFIDSPFEELENYFHVMYKTPDGNFEIINNCFNRPKYNCKFNNQAELINSITLPDNTYLEIGTEYGYCFKQVHFKDKKGVDPDPKYIDDNIYKMTSNEYFSSIGSGQIKKYIFIDGLHWVENVFADFINSMNNLADDGIIFIDDILPLNYDEQLKIPKKHYYENNILKYGEPWTGNVWKFVYYLLLNHSGDISFKYYYNQYYRGVIAIKIINKIIFNYDELVPVIISYSYYEDFQRYIDLLRGGVSN